MTTKERILAYIVMALCLLVFAGALARLAMGT